MAKVKQEVRLPCMAVGSPSPQLHWQIIDGKPIPQNQDRIRQLPDGSLQINGVQKGDAGNYTCMVKNKYGHHMVTHELVVNGPPAPPDIMLTSQTINSFTIKLYITRDKFLVSTYYTFSNIWVGYCQNGTYVFSY